MMKGNRASGPLRPVRTDVEAAKVRRCARRAQDVAQALAIAVVLNGASREGAAKIGRMDVRHCVTG
jgi:hypothetical protein